MRRIYFVRNIRNGHIMARFDNQYSAMEMVGKSNISLDIEVHDYDDRSDDEIKRDKRKDILNDLLK